MTEKEFQNIIFDYSQMNVDSLIDLKNLVEDYPYCQTAQILYLLNLKRLGEDIFDTRLPYTAICVSNRQRLKRAVENVEDMVRGTRHEIRNVPCGEECHSEQSEEPSPHPAPCHFKPIQKSFGTKTISDLLNLKKSEPDIKKTSQNFDDKLLEQLRLEALAKVNDRLNEARKTTMVSVNFTETPNRMIAAQDIIDKVIATNPKISKVDDSDARLSKLSTWKLKEEHSLRENFELVSETLAQLYIAQGAPAKAREIYKTLSKIHPEKAEYFTQLSKQMLRPSTSLKRRNSATAKN
jgi:hypothetical protein